MTRFRPADPVANGLARGIPHRLNHLEEVARLVDELIRIAEPLLEAAQQHERLFREAAEINLGVTRVRHARGTLFPIYMCQREGIQHGHALRQHITGVAIDDAIGALVVDAVSPLALEVSLGIQQSER